MSLDNNKSSSLIGELSSHVRTNSKPGILNCLSKIKNDSKIIDNLVKNDTEFDILIKLLRYQNSKILDMTLSILANAFIKPAIREKINEDEIAKNVVWILKNLTSGMTLHCRACRLISNMAESRRHTRALCNVDAIGALASVLDSKSNTQTITMAIRAIRNIWSINEQSHERIINQSVIENIINYLVQSRNKLEIDPSSSKYKQLEESCLKALKVFTDSNEDRCDEQLRGKLIGGLKCIVELCELNNRMAYKILCRLSQTAEYRPLLGQTSAIECIINILKSNRRDSLSSSIHYEAISSICFFSREAVNRVKIRNYDGLQVMLKLLEDQDNENYHALILHALTLYLYDAESVSIMIKNGIVNVLANRLKSMALDVQSETSNESNEEETASRKRSADAMTPPHSTRWGEIKCNRTIRGRFSLDYCSSQWSPSSENSSSPSTSPSWPSNYPEDDEDENYSPVCSDTEENENTTQQDDVDSLNSYMSSQVENEANNYEPEINASHMWTILLFTRLTFWNDPIEGLANPTIIQALTAYIEASKNLRAPVILKRIIKNHVYFLPLLLQGFVFDAQSLDHSQEYLRIFSSTAESGGAFGELATTLLRGKDSEKYMVAVSVPFVLKSRDKLRTLLNNYGGLELIFHVLANQDHHLNDNSVLSICRLAETLGVTPSSTDEKTRTSNLQDSDDTENYENNLTNSGVGKNIVTFELDDGGTVDACRKVLCEKSEYFTAMLEGKFFEGGQKRVRLQNATSGGLAALCSAISGQLFTKNNDKNSMKKEEEEEEEPTIESLLDAVLLADKFLMFEESDKLTETSMTKLTSDNLVRAWNWAKTNNCNEFKVCCIKNFLACNLSREDRLRAFKSFSGHDHFQEILNDIRTILNDSLLMR